MLRRFFEKRHHILVNEADVTKALRIINTHCPYLINQRLIVDDCGWGAVDPNRWFIHFDCTAREWNAIYEDFECIKGLIIDENRF